MLTALHVCTALLLSLPGRPQAPEIDVSGQLWALEQEAICIGRGTDSETRIDVRTKELTWIIGGLHADAGLGVGADGVYLLRQQLLSVAFDPDESPHAVIPVERGVAVVTLSAGPGTYRAGENSIFFTNGFPRISFYVGTLSQSAGSNQVKWSWEKIKGPYWKEAWRVAGGYHGRAAVVDDAGRVALLPMFGYFGGTVESLLANPAVRPQSHHVGVMWLQGFGETTLAAVGSSGDGHFIRHGSCAPPRALDVGLVAARPSDAVFRWPEQTRFQILVLAPERPEIVRQWWLVGKKSAVRVTSEGVDVVLFEA